jgi:magnesium-transporting ATPase (P-type)
MWFDIGYVGVIMAVGTLGVMDCALPGGLIGGGLGAMEYAHTLAFTTLVFFQLFNVFNARFDNHSAFHKLGSNPWLWLAVLVSAALILHAIPRVLAARPGLTTVLELPPLHYQPRPEPDAAWSPHVLKGTPVPV